MSDQKNKENDVLKFGLYALAVIALLSFIYVFISSVLGRPLPSEKAIYWLLGALAVFVVPYIKEISFRDLKIKLDESKKEAENLKTVMKDSKEEIKKTVDSFSSTVASVNKMAEKFGKIRDELVRGYRVYLDTLEKEGKLKEKSDNVKKLTKLYLEEFGWTVEYLKKQLRKVSSYDGEINDELDDGLVQAIIQFQEDNDIAIDGIFGHQSLLKLNEVLSRR